MRGSLFLYFLYLMVFQARAQRHCATALRTENEIISGFFPGGKFFESELQKLINLEEKSVSFQDDSIYYIPVVVHVLHNGEPEGTGRNLSVSRIQSQIEILNQDYGREGGSPGFNSNPVGTDTRIRFCLATQDPQGNPSSGIVRVNTGVDAFDIFTQNTQLKGYSNWDPEKYLNIWTCKLLGNYIGYAQYPMISPLWADSLPMVTNIQDVQPDGVVIEYRVFGNVPAGESGPYPSYNKGRTASHEVGHYLGLLHIWGDGNACSDNKTDFCSDTPPQATFTSGCPNPPAQSCISGTPVMFENYMDYTNDVCMNVFTVEQKKRMRIVLRNCIRRRTVKSTTSGCGISSNKPTEAESGLFRLITDFEKEYLEIVPQNIEIKEVRIFDIVGRPLIMLETESNYSSYSTRIKTAGLGPGTFFVRVKDGDGRLRLASFRHL